MKIVISLDQVVVQRVVEEQELSRNDSCFVVQLLDWNQMVRLDFLFQIRWLDKVCTAVRQQAEAF